MKILFALVSLATLSSVADVPKSWIPQMCGGLKIKEDDPKRFEACLKAFNKCQFPEVKKLDKKMENCVASEMKSYCPKITPPRCGKTQTVGIVLEQGCGVPICTDSDDCPIYSRPQCKPDEEIVMMLSGRGCRKPLCVINSTPEHSISK